MKKKISLIILVWAFLALGFWLGTLLGDRRAEKLARQLESEQPPSGQIRAVFACDGDKNIAAVFNTQVSADLTFSDGRRLILPRALSASGARYANAAGTLVFWNKGDTAFFEENGAPTYNNCLVSSR